MVLYSFEYTFYDLNLIARSIGSTFKKKGKNANGLVEVHNDGITETSRIIAQEREPLQRTIVFKPDEITILK